jgi:hypothetical protein
MEHRMERYLASPNRFALNWLTVYLKERDSARRNRPPNWGDGTSEGNRLGMEESFFELGDGTSEGNILGMKESF